MPAAINTSFRPARQRITPLAAFLLITASAAWLITVIQMRDTRALPAATGLGVVSFLAIWTPMMAAMMLPSVTPLASLYAQTVRTHRVVRLGAFTGGYLLVWTAVGVPIFALAYWANRVAPAHATSARIMAVVVWGLCGLYQLTSLKQRCLRRCRSPFAQLLQYSGYRGPSRDM